MPENFNRSDHIHRKTEVSQMIELHASHRTQIFDEILGCVEAYVHKSI